MVDLKPFAAIGLIAALAGAGIYSHNKQAEQQRRIEASIPYKTRSIPLKRLQPYFCTSKSNGNSLTIDFKLKDMTNSWGGVVYDVSEDLTLYRFLEIEMSSPGIARVRIEAQPDGYQAGNTVRKLIKLEKGRESYIIDLHNMIPQNQREKISELKIIVDSMYIRKHLFDTTTKGGTLELSDIVLKTKREEKK